MLAFSGFWLLAPGFRRLQDGTAHKAVILLCQGFFTG